eukprot:6450413-Prymnesium_polylepis.1
MGLGGGMSASGAAVPGAPSKGNKRGKQSVPGGAETAGIVPVVARAPSGVRGSLSWRSACVARGAWARYSQGSLPLPPR